MEINASKNQNITDLSAYAVARRLENGYVFAKNQQDRPQIDGDAFVYSSRNMAAFYETTREAADRSKAPGDKQGQVWQSTTPINLLNSKAFLKNLEEFRDSNMALTRWGQESGTVYSTRAYFVTTKDEEDERSYECDTMQEALDAAGVTPPVDLENLEIYGIEEYKKWRPVSGPQFPREKTDDYLVTQWAKANGFDGIWSDLSSGILFSQSAQKAQWTSDAPAPLIDHSHPAMKGLSDLMVARRSAGQPDVMASPSQNTSLAGWKTEGKQSKPGPG